MPEEKMEKEVVETAKEEIQENTEEVVETVEVKEAEEVVEAEEVAEAKEVVEAEETAPAEETASSERTLAEAIELAERKAVSAVPKKQRNKKGIIAVTALVLVLVLLFSLAFANGMTMSDEEYYPLLEEASLVVVDNSYTAFIVLSSRISYFSENDYIDMYYLDALLELQESISETDAMMDEISNPPSTYKEHYTLLKNYYNSYLDCLDLAINYGEDEEAYVEEATALFDQFIIDYTALYEIMVGDLLVE